VDFSGELNAVLPPDLPNRAFVIEKSAAHLELIVEANKVLNLTRITSPREAAIKHVLDSVMPWRLFAHATQVLDAGTGPGFPGLPLALVLPQIRFTLAESIQKKARFVEVALTKLELPNVGIVAERAEKLKRPGGFDVVTARALAPLSRALPLLAPLLKSGAAALLYKGPDIEQEIAEAALEAKKIHARIEVVMRYDLPDSLGTRAIVQISV
jgi:16S rRNA (guanine527-N7)-methyltransferase